MAVLFIVLSTLFLIGVCLYPVNENGKLHATSSRKLKNFFINFVCVDSCVEKNEFRY